MMKIFFMRKLINIIFSIFIILIPLILGGCAATNEEVQDLTKLNNRQICMDFMTYPTLNRLQNAREAIIKRKGIDCWKYGNVNSERNKADENLRNTFRNNNGKDEPFTQPSTTNCYRSGDYMRCTTN